MFPHSLAQECARDLLLLLCLLPHAPLFLISVLSLPFPPPLPEMFLSRSPRRTGHIQLPDLFFWPLWNIWQYWSLSPFWTFCNPLFINACPDFLLILPFLYYSFSVSFTSSLFFLYPPLNVDVKKKNVDVCQGATMVLFLLFSLCVSFSYTYVLVTLKSVRTPDLFWSLDPNTQLPIEQLHLDDSWASQSQCIQLT